MPSTRRIDPAGHVNQVGDADYADAFEVVLEKPDPRSAEDWMRCAFWAGEPASQSREGKMPWSAMQ
jgi:hypothetical protein